MLTLMLLSKLLRTSLILLGELCVLGGLEVSVLGDG